MITERVDVPTIVTAGRTLALATAEYRDQPTKPERLWNLQEAKWNLNRFPMGLSKSDVVIPDVLYTEDQMRKFMGARKFRRVANPDFALYLPEVASTAPEGLVLLGKAYPEMKSSAFQDGTPVKNVDRFGNAVSLHGWMRTESGIDVPYTNTNENQAEEIVGKNGRKGQTLNVYAEAGQQSKLVSPNFQYLDEVRTWTRIMSSRVGGRVVGAYFFPDGRCRVYWLLRPGDADDSVGVRSVGV